MARVLVNRFAYIENIPLPRVLVWTLTFIQSGPRLRVGLVFLQVVYKPAVTVMSYKFFNRGRVGNMGVFCDMSRYPFPFVSVQLNSLLFIVKPRVVRREVPVVGFFYQQSYQDWPQQCQLRGQFPEGELLFLFYCAVRFGLVIPLLLLRRRFVFYFYLSLCVGKCNRFSQVQYQLDVLFGFFVRRLITGYPYMARGLLYRKVGSTDVYQKLNKQIL